MDVYIICDASRKGATELVSASLLGKAHQWCHSRATRQRNEQFMRGARDILILPPLPTDCQGTITEIGPSGAGDGRQNWQEMQGGESARHTLNHDNSLATKSDTLLS